MVEKKGNYWLSSVASSLDEVVMQQEGQDAWKRADSWLAGWGRELCHLRMRVA